MRRRYAGDRRAGDPDDHDRHRAGGGTRDSGDHDRRPQGRLLANHPGGAVGHVARAEPGNNHRGNHCCRPANDHRRRSRRSTRHRHPGNNNHHDDNGHRRGRNNRHRRPGHSNNNHSPDDGHHRPPGNNNHSPDDGHHRPPGNNNHSPDDGHHCPDRGRRAEVDDAEASEVGRHLPNDQLTLEPIDTLTGNLAPKSIVASGTGLYFAQNMMYVHTVSVFDETKQLIKTIDDSVDLKGFGYDVDGDTYQGAPVEAAFTSDGSFAFVSNYRMYGPGYDPQAGGDSCDKDQGQDSFVYRIDTESLEIDRVYPVGPIPKFLAVTPDDRFLLVSNWCGFDVTIIDLATHTPISEIEVGRYPRGIAVTSDGRTAYVAVMGSTDVAVIGLPAWATGRHRYEIPGVPLLLPYLSGVGASPRHLVLSPDDRILYATLNGEDAVVAVDVATGDVVGRVQTGHRPRSMDISDDGTRSLRGQLRVGHHEQDPHQRPHRPAAVHHRTSSHRHHL